MSQYWCSPPTTVWVQVLPPFLPLSFSSFLSCLPIFCPFLSFLPCFPSFLPPFRSPFFPCTYYLLAVVLLLYAWQPNFYSLPCYLNSLLPLLPPQLPPHFALLLRLRASQMLNYTWHHYSYLHKSCSLPMKVFLPLLVYLAGLIVGLVYKQFISPFLKINKCIIQDTQLFYHH